MPREEGSFEQWIFQVKGSQTQHTEDAICSGIINSVRGEARDLVEYVGFGGTPYNNLGKVGTQVPKIAINR